VGGAAHAQTGKAQTGDSGNVSNGWFHVISPEARMGNPDVIE
jgi:hypothetical protein